MNLLRAVRIGVSTTFMTRSSHVCSIATMPIRAIATTSTRWSIRDDHRTGLRLNRVDEAMEGSEGANSYIEVRTNVDRLMPTLETLRTKFDGVLFTDLPMVFIKATRNNTLIHVMDPKYKAITYTSCRMEGFKNARKKTTIAGQTTGVAAGQRLLRRGINTVRVLVKGIGPVGEAEMKWLVATGRLQGRTTAVKGLAVAGVNVVSITDRTLLPEVGPRPRKVRRV